MFSPSKIITFIKKYNFLIYVLIQKQFIIRYRRTLIGYYWSLLNPTVALIILTLVFSNLFGQDPKTFAIFLFSGLVAFNFFSACILTGSKTFFEYHGLIDKVNLPKILFPVAVVASVLVDSFLVFIALLIMMFFLGSPISINLLIVPISYLALVIFTFGLTLVVSILTVFYRDVQQIIPYILQSLFFLSPILYPKTQFGDGLLSFFISLNPISVYVELFRAPIYEGNLPSLFYFISGFSLSFISLTVGLLFFFKYKHLIIFKL